MSGTDDNFVGTVNNPHPRLRQNDEYWEFIFPPSPAAGRGMPDAVLKVEKAKVPKVTLNTKVKAMILHHLANANKWHRQTGPDRATIAEVNRRFWRYMPPVRPEDYSDMDNCFRSKVMEKVFDAINNEITAVSKAMREAGLWTMSGELSTYPNSLRTAMGFQDPAFAPLYTAPMLLHQVNQSDFDGTVRLDAKICGVANGELARVCRASLRENPPATKEKLLECMEAIQVVFMDALEGKTKAFAMSDLP
ncbi:uncharacterized protein AB675_8237 [Cyphellophora attinorum]|uniref:Uncharacterized protein n=1 Tax=Cyphellophora attinorum TaxID=1664694 RepID=A0A0N1HWJ3_9EURO|nr:uncharacterized protein AB675_8237 [Phialophora attinorum]KPI44585.1 hypothetical protein AB675_8237 [Phialophora attinorum]